ncbi:hypothetical protein SS37A_38870 (plasmid) [Methylocystis iwaonis]|uniref:Uncharacterized protein n=1 Tax=Methylocystis iwaonis TaxID=2885079 RepID=A0ABN6VMT9_9HYPH|nr:hypothetical protein SS37A_38870 [Methylocystis iwaonis]
MASFAIDKHYISFYPLANGLARPPGRALLAPSALPEPPAGLRPSGNDPIAQAF